MLIRYTSLYTWGLVNLLQSTRSIKLYKGQDGMSRILLKFCIQVGIWKKNPEPEDEYSETSEAGNMAPEFPIFWDLEEGLYISNGSNFFVFEDSSKMFSILNR